MIRVIDYEHPARHVREPLRARTARRAFGAVRQTAFAGAWQGNGFHEDGLASGLRAAAALRGDAGEVRALRRHRHARAPTPHDNVFRYPVYMALLDLDELPVLDRRLRLFGWNRRRGHELPRRAITSTCATCLRRTRSSSATAARSRC